VQLEDYNPEDKSLPPIKVFLGNKPCIIKKMKIVESAERELDQDIILRIKKTFIKFYAKIKNEFNIKSYKKAYNHYCAILYKVLNENQIAIGYGRSKPLKLSFKSFSEIMKMDRKTLSRNYNFIEIEKANDNINHLIEEIKNEIL
jgi:hypothetical protein